MSDTLMQTIVNKGGIDGMLGALLVTMGEPDQVIDNGEGPYLERWYIVRNSKRRDSGIGNGNVYLHHFLQSDYDRALHDHPWQSVSVVLGGEFYDVTEEKGAVYHKTGDVIFRDANTPHRVELINGQPAWTLFITGEKVREWGFHCEDGWKHWREFESNGNRC